MQNNKLQNLKVSENRRFLAKEDGSPFFWLGDTAWELFHRLNREDADHYLKTRSSQKFNVVQAVALAEFEGITVPNSYGRLPLLMNGQGIYDPTLPDVSGEYSYWDHVDYIVDKAAEYGMYIGLLPTWGDKYNLASWGKGPVIFSGENAYAYGKWIGERYKDRVNIVWILGGDRPLETSLHFEVINGMAKGLKAGDNGKHLLTFHPPGGVSSSKYVHDEPWLDFNMLQTGHGALNIDTYSYIKSDYDKLPVKPVLDGEPRYEDHGISFKPENGYFDDFDVRQAAWWAVLAGGFGHTYGHHSIWSMCTETASYFIMNWKDALMRPGATHMKHIKALIESRPFFERIPDLELLAENYQGASHLQACRGKSYVFIYSPCGLKIRVNMGRITGKKVKVSWYNPRSGETTACGEYDNTGIADFNPPSSGRNNDWVLVLDDAAH